MIHSKILRKTSQELPKNTRTSSCILSITLEKFSLSLESCPSNYKDSIFIDMTLVASVYQLPFFTINASLCSWLLLPPLILSSKIPFLLNASPFSWNFHLLFLKPSSLQLTLLLFSMESSSPSLLSFLLPKRLWIKSLLN